MAVYHRNFVDLLPGFRPRELVAMRFIWVDSQDLVTVLRPFRVIFLDLGILGPAHCARLQHGWYLDSRTLCYGGARQMCAPWTGQMSSVETGQMSVVETGQMSAAATGQMSAVPESSGFAWACGA